MDNTSDDVPPKEEAGDNNDVKIVIRKRGRPKGAANKPKAVVVKAKEKDSQSNSEFL